MKTVFITDNMHMGLDSSIIEFLENIAGGFNTEVVVDNDTLFELKEQVLKALQKSGLELSNMRKMTAGEFNQAYNVSYASSMEDFLIETPSGLIGTQNIRTARFYNLQIWDKESDMRVYHKQTINSLLGGIKEFCAQEGIWLVTGRGK